MDEPTGNNSSSLSNTSPSECSEPDKEASTASKGQHRTQAEKKMDRILANRRSARRSRERRKKLQQNLEISVAFLGRQNEELSRENNMLKQELRVLINLVNQMNKNTPMSNDVGTESLLQQVRLAAAANSAITNTATAPSTSDSLANTTAMLSGARDGFNSMSPEQVLALSQLLSQQNQPPQGFPPS
jgi:hypothetical protein